MCNVTGVILAGGYSNRASTNKLLLKVDSKPLISHTINSIKNFVDKVIVVTGYYDKELRPYLNDVEIVYNENFASGMFSSVLAGVRHSSGDVFILPGDIANISQKTFKSILQNKGHIRIPTYNGDKGHPLFLSEKMKDLLLKEDINSNLEKFIFKHSDEINLVPVDDSFIKFDIDTIQDYENFLNIRKEMTYED